MESNRFNDTSNVEDVIINTANLTTSQINALDQLLQFQCERLERKLVTLRNKRKSLIDGEIVHVSLNELVSRELIEAAEKLASKNPFIDQDEITRIINNINSRGDGKHVKFTNHFGYDDECLVDYAERHELSDFFTERGSKKFTATSNSSSYLELSGEVQLILHAQGNCKPCAFFYNKKKGCRNGPNCGFCHHEDHALCSLKQWKRQQKMVAVCFIMSLLYSCHNDN
ncbi:conserved hypothetical protein [Theileria equi strain WA]|uniref:C3H1-type domain-containing protein n=1 Tax=Theileria equi strain WA TaxID=1537102 RepID=L1LD21_THEEQ|nr:conserved hypothetical protein [Theileria equi strain WA]EKX73179.1 conserved hypothetical protein [Theileria equi strain WA]|eukprot:XP_004832631.1 conserved hypothetical protein [Theileria equi strain WA]